MRENPPGRRRSVRLGLLVGLCVCGLTAMAFAEPATPSGESAEKPAKSGAVVPGPGSLSLVVLAGGCLLYGRRRPNADAK